LVPFCGGDFSFSFSITALKSVAAVNNMIPDENKNKMKHKADFNKNQVLHTPNQIHFIQRTKE
jgi:hypothetical protein